MSPGEQLDVVCVGDVATDEYIALSKDRVTVADEHGDHLLEIPFGAKVPFERAVTIEAGGDAANVAVALARLGLAVGLASYVGDDGTGRDMVAALAAEGVDTGLVRIATGHPTNHHFVLWLTGERTILTHHEPYPYRWSETSGDQVPTWLFLTSISAHTEDYLAEIAQWLDVHPEVRLAFEPGTHQIDGPPEAIAPFFRRADFVICNREEAAQLVGRPAHTDAVALLDALHELGPRDVVITDGSAGAYASDGRERVWVPAYPDDEPIVDRTGAGDAFAATVLAGLVRGMSLSAALLRAPINSMSVVHALGTQAGLLREDQVEAVLAHAPASYSLTPLDEADLATG